MDDNDPARMLSVLQYNIIGPSEERRLTASSDVPASSTSSSIMSMISEVDAPSASSVPAVGISAASSASAAGLHSTLLLQHRLQVQVEVVPRKWASYGLHHRLAALGPHGLVGPDLSSSGPCTGISFSIGSGAPSFLAAA